MGKLYKTLGEVRTLAAKVASEDATLKDIEELVWKKMELPRPSIYNTTELEKKIQDLSKRLLGTSMDEGERKSIESEREVKIRQWIEEGNADELFQGEFSNLDLREALFDLPEDLDLENVESRDSGKYH